MLNEMTKEYGITHTKVELEFEYLHSPTTQGEVDTTEILGITQGAVSGNTINTQALQQQQRVEVGQVDGAVRAEHVV